MVETCSSILKVPQGEPVARDTAKRSASARRGFADQIPMHRTYYGAVERGEKNLQLSTLERVCESFEVPMWEVIRDAERAE